MAQTPTVSGNWTSSAIWTEFARGSVKVSAHIANAVSTPRISLDLALIYSPLPVAPGM